MSATPVAPQPLIVDSSVSCKNAAPRLAARGIKVVMRYYSQPDYPYTILSAAEANAIHQSWMAIAVIYQYNSGDIRYFDPSWAHEAAKACMSRDARLSPDADDTITHPKGTAIYFGVDGDLTGVKDKYQREKNIVTIMDYFKFIRDDFAKKEAPFKIGVYGSGDVCERLVGNLATYGWIAGFSTGWKNTREAYNETEALHWHIFQNALEVPLDVPVDTSILNPRSRGIIGAFNKSGLVGALDDTAVRAILRFVASPEGATLFRSPGQGSLGSVAQNRMVSMLESGPTWSKVETTFKHGNTGSTKQGYMKSDLLTSIDRMV